MALEPKAKVINSQNFDTLIAGEQPVVLDFGAEWCGPCQMVAPIIEELAKEYEGKVIIGKCDVDQDQDLPGRFGVRNIPTIIFVKGGEVVEKKVGAQSKDALKKSIEGLL